MIFEDKLIIALLLIHAATDVDDAILAGLVGHDAARGVVVGDHEVLYGAVGVVAECADRSMASSVHTLSKKGMAWLHFCERRKTAKVE